MGLHLTHTIVCSHIEKSRTSLVIHTSVRQQLKNDSVRVLFTFFFGMQFCMSIVISEEGKGGFSPKIYFVVKLACIEIAHVQRNPFVISVR